MYTKLFTDTVCVKLVNDTLIKTITNKMIRLGLFDLESENAKFRKKKYKFSRKG